MRILVISDIHGNLNALNAVLEDAGTVDAAWCLGDLVGYGPNPNECIERTRSLPNFRCVKGNHDAAAAGEIPLEAFNSDACLSAEWNRVNITTENLEYLHSLPSTWTEGKVTLVHGSPRDPMWEYILDWYSAYLNFPHLPTDICMVGHTHFPMIFSLEPGEEEEYIWMQVPSGREEVPCKAILNPGSVGQPRDNDARAAYAIYESELGIWEAHRVVYNVGETQALIRQSGLPERNASRLEGGW